MGEGGTSEDMLQFVLVRGLMPCANLFFQIKRKQGKVLEVQRLSITHCGTVHVHKSKPDKQKTPFQLSILP